MNPDGLIDYKALYEQSQLRITVLQHELEQLKRLIYGSKHERFIPSTSPRQLSLDLPVETLQPPTPAAEEKPVVQQVSYTRTLSSGKESTIKVPAARMKLPDHLPRERVLIEPIEDVSGMVKIGEEITE